MTDGQASTDNQILAGFIATVYDDLDALVDLREVLFLPPYRDQSTVEAVRAFGEAWPEVLGELNVRVSEVINLDSTMLVANGLGGAELRLKIAVWRRARVAAVAEFENSDDREARSGKLPSTSLPNVSAEASSFPRKLPRRVRRGLKWVSRMLDYADTIIGSLARIAQQFERLKELKETIEKLAGDVADEYPEAG